jgi:hypothetical protein
MNVHVHLITRFALGEIVQFSCKYRYSSQRYSPKLAHVFRPSKTNIRGVDVLQSIACIICLAGCTALRQLYVLTNYPHVAEARQLEQRVRLTSCEIRCMVLGGQDRSLDRRIICPYTRCPIADRHEVLGVEGVAT